MCKNATSNVCVPAIRKRHEVFVARDKGCHLGQAHGKPYDTSRARRKVWVSSASNQDMNEHGYDTARERANVWAWRECPPEHRSWHALISAVGRGCMELLPLRGIDEGHASLSSCRCRQEGSLGRKSLRRLRRPCAGRRRCSCLFVTTNASHLRTATWGGRVDCCTLLNPKLFASRAK